MKSVVFLLTSLILLPLAFNFHSALAHEECVSGDIKIIVGWANEPPLVNQLNGIELTITRVSDEQPITNAIAQLETSIKKGGQTKSLDFQPQEEPGVYAATILPTQTGQYATVIKGTITGQAIDCQIAIEDAEDTSRFTFPPSTTSDPIPQEVIEQLKSVIADLATQVDEAKIAAEDAKTAAADATDTSTELKAAADRAYLFGIIGVGVGVAGIAIGVVALSRREKI